MLRKIIIIFVIFVSFYSCQKTKSSKIVFVLFDLSASTKQPEIRKRYFNDFNKILAQMGSGDRLIADCITEDPMAQSNFPINTEFKSFNVISGNKLKFDAAEKKVKKQINKTVDSLVFNFKRKIYSTKIFESLQLAERVFKIYHKDRKRLVLFSDMIEESPSYNFKRLNLTQSQQQRIITLLKNSDRLPDLSGTQVYVVGANSGAYQNMPVQKTVSVRNFWIKYFSACGAVLKKELYGGPLIGFKN